MNVILVKLEYAGEERFIGVINKDDLFDTIVKVVDKGMTDLEGYCDERGSFYYNYKHGLDENHIKSLIENNSVKDLNCYFNYMELIEVPLGTLKLDGSSFNFLDSI